MRYYASAFKRFLLKFKRPHKVDQTTIERAQSFAEGSGYIFKNPELLINALKHRSYLSISNESRLFSNERLELLGDAVLGLVVTDYLYQKFPEQEEGELTTVKSLLVSREILAHTARDISLGDYILLNEAEEKAGGRHRMSILADTLEALIGAIYLDGGLESARTFIQRVLLKNLKKILSEEKNKNFKSILLEYSQSKSMGLPLYNVRSEEGPDHRKLFTVEVRIQNEILGLGKGTSKKNAEQHAAQNALRKLLVI